MLPSAARCSALEAEIAGRPEPANLVQVPPLLVLNHQLPSVVSALTTASPSGPGVAPLWILAWSGSVMLVPFASTPASTPTAPDGAPSTSSAESGRATATVLSSTGESLTATTLMVPSAKLVVSPVVPSVSA